jgi:hypothetical protein
MTTDGEEARVLGYIASEHVSPEALRSALMSALIHRCRTDWAEAALANPVLRVLFLVDGHLAVLSARVEALPAGRALRMRNANVGVLLRKLREDRT